MNSKLNQQSDEISVQELFQKLKSIWRFLISKWFKILTAVLVGSLLGFIYGYIQPVKYVAKLSFVVEDAKSGGGLASLAGQFGFDIGGTSSGGFFSGDNILLFLKSEGLIRETLMTYYDETKKVTLADQYATASKLKKKWKKNEKVGDIDFSNFSSDKLPRKEDSLMQIIVSTIKKSDLFVGKPDKKASFIEVKVSTQDELLSKLFIERLVYIATSRYIESKTTVKALNVGKLQRRADSLSAVLNNKTYASALNQQSLVDANPALRTAPIASEISSREKTMAATIFAEVVKNLEISKTMLSQETPVIQMVDESTFPLPKDKTSKLSSLIVGGFLFGFFYMLFLVFKKWYSSLI